MTRAPLYLGALLIPFVGEVLAQGITYNPDLHPIHRRTLRMGFSAPEGAKVKIAFFDADSTLRVSKSGAPTANHGTDVELLPLVSKVLKDVKAEGYAIAIVSNQGGIPRYISLEESDKALKYTIKLLNDQGATVDYYDIAEKEDVFRKPSPGMGNLAAQIISLSTGKEIDWDNSYMVGDSAWKKDEMDPSGHPGIDFSNSDRLFAERLHGEHGGMKFIYASAFFGWNSYGIKRFDKLAQVQEFFEQHPDLRP